MKSTRLLDQLREQIRHLHYAFAPKKRTFIGVKKFTPLARKRCEMLVRRIEQVFPGVADTRTPEQGGDPQFWYGLRPATPTNIPLIGRLLAAEESLDQRRPRHIGVDAPRARARRWPN